MAVQNPPEGYHALTPYLMVEDAAGFMQFLKDAFGARQNGDVARDPEGNVMHADFSIGDSHIMFGGTTAQWPEPATCSIHVYIDDVDEVYKRALAAGATSVKEPKTEFYGDRAGCVRDTWGNTWWVSTHVEDVAPEEMQARMEKLFA